MIKSMLAGIVGASALAFVPQPVDASECTDGYVQCLNDTSHYSGALLLLADIECFAGYVGCLSETVMAS